MFISFKKLPKVTDTCMNFEQVTAYGQCEKYDLNYAMVYYPKCKSVTIKVTS